MLVPLVIVVVFATLTVLGVWMLFILLHWLSRSAVNGEFLICCIWGQGSRGEEAVCAGGGDRGRVRYGFLAASGNCWWRERMAAG